MNQAVKQGMSKRTKWLVIGLVTALVGGFMAMTPYGIRLEEDVGLAWLFKLRGSRAAPKDVVVITTDKESAFDLELPQEPWKWPRSLHGDLIRRLTQQGATVIAFDLFFKDPSVPAEDTLFAEAMAETDKVILFEKLSSTQSATEGLFIRKSPLPLFANAARALAPNPLPAVPFRVNQFWLFDETPDHVPTLPFLAFHTHAMTVYGQFVGLVNKVAPEISSQLPQPQGGADNNRDLQRFVQDVRGLFRKHPELADRLLQGLAEEGSGTPLSQRTMLRSFIKAYASPIENRYLDFYGPPRSITTVPYSCVLERCQRTTGDTPNENQDFNGKAVFVGFSEHIPSEQQDRFHTVFTSASGIYISGVEIAATAFANLLEDRQVQPLKGWQVLGVVATWAIVLSLAFHILPVFIWLRSGIGVATMYLVTAAGTAFVYVGVAYVLFTWNGWWLPLVVPLLVQLPCGLFGALFLRFWETHRERQNIQAALEHYVPAPVAHQLTRSIEEIKTMSQLVEGVCLSTDAEHYTKVAESFELEKLREFMNQYYKTIFEPVRRRGGIVSDVVGDAVLAIWAAPRLDRALRQQVCEAALDIALAVETFNQSHPETPLPTRIGLHGGRMVLGNVGAMDHYEYRAVGDIVNTASRIEGLNKYLGTRILVSQMVVQDLDEILARELGCFRLKGKKEPLVIFELIGRSHEAEEWKVEALNTFAFGLAAFQNQRWDEACTAFQTYLAVYGDDGPCRYYLEACNKFKVEPPVIPWEGEMTLMQK